MKMIKVNIMTVGGFFNLIKKLGYSKDIKEELLGSHEILSMDKYKWFLKSLNLGKSIVNKIEKEIKLKNIIATNYQKDFYSEGIDGDIYMNLYFSLKGVNCDLNEIEKIIMKKDKIKCKQKLAQYKESISPKLKKAPFTVKDLCYWMDFHDIRQINLIENKDKKSNETLTKRRLFSFMKKYKFSKYLMMNILQIIVSWYASGFSGYDHTKLYELRYAMHDFK